MYGQKIRRKEFSIEENFLVMYVNMAEQGDPDAQYILSEHYKSERNKNLGESTKWLKLAANQNHKDALYQLGLRYMNGDGVSQNFKKALERLNLAADKGVLDAKYEISLCHIDGSGIQKNNEEGIKLLKECADQGHASSQYILGMLYILGDNVEKNIKKGKKLLKQAAEEENADACYALSLLYRRGKYVRKDLEKSAVFAKKSIDLGYIEFKEAGDDINNKSPKLYSFSKWFGNINNSINSEEFADDILNSLGEIHEIEDRLTKIGIILEYYKSSYELDASHNVLRKICEAHLEHLRNMNNKSTVHIVSQFIEASKYACKYFIENQNSDDLYIKFSKDFSKVYVNKLTLFIRFLSKNNEIRSMQELNDSVKPFADFDIKDIPEIKDIFKNSSTEEIIKKTEIKKEIKKNNIDWQKNPNILLFKEKLQKRLENSFHNDRVITEGFAARKEDRIDSSLKIANVLSSGVAQNHWVGFAGALGTGMTKEVRDKVYENACARTDSFTKLRIGHLTIKVVNRIASRYRTQIIRIKCGEEGLDNLVDYFHDKAMDDLHSVKSSFMSFLNSFGAREASVPEDKLFDILIDKNKGKDLILRLVSSESIWNTTTVISTLGMYSEKSGNIYYYVHDKKHLFEMGYCYIEQAEEEKLKEVGNAKNIISRTKTFLDGNKLLVMSMDEYKAENLNRV